MLHNKKRKILHFLWKGGIGGAERAVYLLAKEQAKCHDVQVGVAFCSSGGYYFDKMRMNTGSIVFSFNINNTTDFAKLPRAVELVKQYDVHHFHSANIFGSISSIMSGNKTRVYTHRGGFTNYSVRKKFVYKCMAILLKHFFHGYSGNTNHAVKSASKLYDIDTSKFITTYNGIDHSLLTPDYTKRTMREKIGIKSKDVVFGTSAHLRDWKRIDQLIRAMQVFKKNNTKLLIIGDGPDRMRLERIAIECGVYERILFVGSRKRFINYLNTIDVFVLPSTALESFGNALVEAMAIGIPSIAYSDSPGLCEHIVNNETGFIVGDYDQLLAVLKLLFNNSSLRKKIGLSGKAYIKNKYSLRNMMNSYNVLYERAFSESHSKSYFSNI